MGNENTRCDDYYDIVVDIWDVYTNKGSIANKTIIQ